MSTEGSTNQEQGIDAPHPEGGGSPSQQQMPTYQPQQAPQPYQGQPSYEQAPGQQPYQGQPYQGQPYQGQPYQGQPYQTQQYYGQPPVAPVQQSGNGKAVAALVCGILAILFSSSVLFGIILGIVAIVLASQYVKAFGKEGKTTGAKVCGVIGIVFSIIALISYLVFFVVFVAAFEDYGSSYGYSYSYPDSGSNSGSNSGSASPYGTSEDEQAVQQETEKVFAGMASPTQSDIDDFAAEYEEEFESLLGFSMAEAGIDSAAVVKACAASIEYNLDGAFAYSDGTATSYAEVYSCDIMDYLKAFSDEVMALDESGGLSEFETDDYKVKFGEMFLNAMGKAQASEKYIMLEFNRENGVWVVDPDSLEEETGFVFGVYSY